MKLNKDRFRGAMLGLACGDALGTTVEFMNRGSFPPLKDIVGGGPFSLKAGEWTDDTSMALCLAESLLRNKGMNLTDQIEAYLGWWKHGDNSVTGECFDIGNTVRGALENYILTGEPNSGSKDSMSAGNGSIMRLAPVPLFYAKTTDADLMTQCAFSSATTHQALECIFACKLFGYLIRKALTSSSKESLLTLDSNYTEALNQLSKQCPTSIQNIAKGSYHSKEEIEIRGSGYVVRSLEAALWCFYHSNSFEEGALKAANLGDDADTTAAVYGQIAGAFYGAKGIPKHWLKILAWRERITRIADKLHSATEKNS